MLPSWSWAPILVPVIFGGHHRRLIPYSVDGAFKQTLLSLFRLAWSNKVQLPLLITVAFMALDVRLQIEVNIFWERPHHQRRNNPNPPPAIVNPEPEDEDEDDVRAPLAEQEDGFWSDDDEMVDQVIAEANAQVAAEEEEDEDDDDDDEGIPLVVQVEFRNS